MSFKRVLVAVDGGEASIRAVDMAKDLATRFDAALGAVYVLPETLPVANEFGYVGPERIAERQQRGHELLRDAQERIGDLRCDRILREGSAPAEIIDAALEWKADLIVVGCHNRGPLQRLLLGSTSESLVHRAPCPVLVVRHAPKAASDSPHNNNKARAILH
jgi:nucleotide-binding universal stress UspA family protein